MIEQQKIQLSSPSLPKRLKSFKLNTCIPSFCIKRLYYFSFRPTAILVGRLLDIQLTHVKILKFVLLTLAFAELKEACKAVMGPSGGDKTYLSSYFTSTVQQFFNLLLIAGDIVLNNSEIRKENYIKILTNICCVVLFEQCSFQVLFFSLKDHIFSGRVQIGF